MKFALPLEQIKELLAQNYSQEQVKGVLQKKHLSLEDMAILLSPAALNLQEELAQKAKALTEERHGKVKTIYIPLYLSNFCHNECSYCGFSISNKLQRKTLNTLEIQQELHTLFERGFRHILLVSGEWEDFKNKDYLAQAVRLAKEKGFSSIAVEMGAMPYDVAKLLREAGADTFVLYQESYNQDVFNQVHLAGQKKNYDFRLQALEVAIEAGFTKVGMGFLTGLAPFAQEILSLFSHAQYVRKKFWNVPFSFSFPRLTEFTGKSRHFFKIEDQSFVQGILALRLAFAESAFYISTREPSTLRDGLLNICMTHLSVESKTMPGGYSQDNEQRLKQFEIHDQRNLETMLEQIKSQGMDVVFKNWEGGL